MSAPNVDDTRGIWVRLVTDWVATVWACESISPHAAAVTTGPVMLAIAAGVGPHVEPTPMGLAAAIKAVYPLDALPLPLADAARQIASAFPWMFRLVPKKALTPAEVEELEGLIRSNLDAVARVPSGPVARAPDGWGLSRAYEEGEPAVEFRPRGAGRGGAA